jgi:hypothetical protein
MKPSVTPIFVAPFFLGLSWISRSLRICPLEMGMSIEKPFDALPWGAINKRAADSFTSEIFGGRYCFGLFNE